MTPITNLSRKVEFRLIKTYRAKKIEKSKAIQLIIAQKGLESKEKSNQNKIIDTVQKRIFVKLLNFPFILVIF